MDLIDRYLAAVGRYLPRHQQDDIVSELADSLRSEIEDRAQTLNRPLTEAEQSALLKQRGHPWLMASRYMPQQYLVGPALFPYYWQAVQIAIFWVVLPLVLIGGAINAVYSGEPTVPAFVGELVRAFSTGWNGAIYAVGIVTIVFFVLDHAKVRITALDNWNPASLPEPGQARFVPRTETVIGLVFTITFIVWWTGLVQTPEYFVQPHEGLRFALAPVWRTFYMPLLLTAMVAAGVHVIDLVRPWRTRLVSVVELLNNAAEVIFLILILNGGEYVVVSGAGVIADQIDRGYWINRVVGLGLMSVVVVLSMVSALQVWRLLRMPRPLVIA